MPINEIDKQPGIERQIVLPVVLLLMLVTLSVYWPATGFDFINTDDPLYVYENTYVQTGLNSKTVAWAFTSFEVANWHPISWLSHLIDVELFGMNAGGHHFTSILLHALNTLLLLFLLIKMTGAHWRSIFVAALFALHPLHVESVVWISERKDVLSTFFWLLCSLAYVDYTRQPGIFRYLGVVVFFLLGIMSKPMLVTLPCVFLLLDYWPLERFSVRKYALSNSDDRLFTKWRPIYEKIPLFIISTVSCWITWIAQSNFGAVKSLEIVPISVRTANALVSYGGYLLKVVWPFPLAFHYPFPDSVEWAKVLLSGLLIGSLSLFMVRHARRFPYILTGWLWYLGTLVPVIGIVQVGTQAMADRYTYIPLIGVFIIITWGWADLTANRSKSMRLTGITLAGVWLSALVLLAGQQVLHWENSISLLSHTLRVTTNNYGVHANLGLALSKEGRHDEAIRHYRKALEIEPRLIKAINNLGVAYEEKGQFGDAADQYWDALRINPNFSGARYNLGLLFTKQGRLAEAMEQYRLALRSNPDDPDILNNLGVTLIAAESYGKAIRAFRRALEISPENIALQNNIGIARFKQGHLETARNIFEGIVRIDSNFKDAHNNLGVIYETQGRLHRAALHYRKVIRIDPGDQKARSGLQRIYRTQRMQEKPIKTGQPLQGTGNPDVSG